LVGDYPSIMEWKLINTAPFDRDLELAVIDSKGSHPVVFPCRRLVDSGWIDVETTRKFTLIPYVPRTGEIGRLTNAHDLPGGMLSQINVSNS
jgi:hypothetical protein